MNIARFSVTLALAGLSLAASGAPTIAGCPVFPADNVWNTPVDTLPVHASSSAWVSTIGATTGIHPDFGTFYLGEPIGIPFVTVPATQPTVPVAFDYADESDPGPYPIPPDAPIEGGAAASGDRHVLVLRTGTCDLFELFDAFPQGAGSSWTAGSGAHFDLRSNAMRPEGWTSADAAGLPILPGLVRYDEVVAGSIEHAFRFTAPHTQAQHIWPATHDASSLTGTQYPPMGARFRLKASVDTSTYPASMQPVLRALKKYGMILADNGSSWYISGEHNPSWNDDVLGSLKQLKGSDFEAVDTTSLEISPTSAQAVQPGSTVPPGSMVTPLDAHRFDLNGDGYADLVFQHADGGIEVRLMHGATVIGSATMTPSAPGTIVGSTGDFNADGKSDLLFVRTDGSVEMWLMDGISVIQSATVMPPGTGWSVAHVADFDGDGKSDLLWRNTNGSVGLWLMDGANVSARTSLMPAGSSWVPTHVGDFDGDGKADILWRASDGSVSMWLMNGALVGGRGPLLPAGSAWSVLHVGDFDGDGKSDILWQAIDGSVSMWTMNGRTATTRGSLMGANATWTVSHVADFNGDGKADLMWRARDGTAGMWLMNGLSVLEKKTVMPGGSGWTLACTPDLSADGKADLVWTQASGAVGAWIMDGTMNVSRAPLEPAGSTSKLVPL